MADIPKHAFPLLRALIAGQRAWQSPQELAQTLGWSEEATIDLLAALDEAGWVAVWVRESGPMVTLSPLAAAFLQVRLAEFGPEEEPRWVPLDQADPPPPRAQRVYSRSRSARLEHVIDHRPGPERAADQAEEARRSGPAWDYASDEPPWPTLLIGVGLTPWPGPREDRGDVCPACKNLPLKPHEYCLCCDRWGLDGKIAGAPTAAGRRGHGSKQPGPGGNPPTRKEARAVRRAKLRARLAAQKELEQLRKRRNGFGGHGGTPLAGSEPVG